MGYRAESDSGLQDRARSNISLLARCSHVGFLTKQCKARCNKTKTVNH